MLKLFNSLTRKKEEFIPIEERMVKMYTCGPTVYNYIHIGNFRTFLFEDLLRRYLKYKGYRVIQVMNLTDIEDKIIRDYQKAGMSLTAFTEVYTQAFFEDIETLNIERAEYYPKATEHIAEMVELIQRLREKGYTYEIDGSIYYDISKFPEYGKLSHIDFSGLKAGGSGRVDTDEYTKEDVKDFVLWKAWNLDDGDAYWETELGKGRPGWHIECSAMSMKYLGESFDIHTGGIDNMFPHHENEITQSEGATGKKFVNFWLHSEHLLVGNTKMSKSLGNFYTLRDLLEKGYKPKVIRYGLMSTHYRQPYNFTLEGLEAAESAMQRMHDFMIRLEEADGRESDIVDLLEKARREFEEGMDDDLNISAALGAIFSFIREINRLMAESWLSSDNARTVKQLMRRFDEVLGILEPAQQEIPREVVTLVEERESARKRRDFARADQLRTKIVEMGYVVEDTPEGSRIKVR